MTDVADAEPPLWRRFGERVVFDRPEVRLSEVDVGLPTRERVWLPVVRLLRSVAVALVDDRDQVMLVRRFRFVQQRWGWELPGGQVDVDENPAEAAVRELEELTGWRAEQLERMVAFQPAAEVVDSEGLVFMGRGAIHAGEPTGLGPGERAEWVPLESVRGLMADGQVWDGISVVGVLGVLSLAR